MWPLSSSVGDADKAIAGAAVKIEQTYTMSDRHHNPMEPHATLGVWDGDGSLTLYDSTQMVVGTKKLVSLVLGIPEDKINVVCEFLGGGFGGKSWSWPHTLLAALAAKVVNRPVRLQLSRAQMYSMVGHQAGTVQTIALGATETASCPASATTASTRHRCSTTTSNTPRWPAATCGVPAAGSPRATESST
jgi:Aerobic-type carbon monoxide dehydrogenase, large subunit CoxL/CutL homologs